MSAPLFGICVSFVFATSEVDAKYWSKLATTRFATSKLRVHEDSPVSVLKKKKQSERGEEKQGLVSMVGELTTQ
jgi:hypothetical protein